VDQKLLSCNEYLVTENRILKRQLKDGSCYPTPSEPRSEKSAIGSAARRSRMW
jgi:hypothetical protein